MLVRRLLHFLAICLISLSVSAREALFTRDWRFHLGDVATAETPDFDDVSWRNLDLPHDWSIEGEFSPGHASGTGFLPGGTGWYRKTFKLPEDSAGKRVFLRFEGVYRNSTVWINGKLLGERPHGYIDFEYDLTPHLNQPGADNTVAVKVAREEVADSRWYPGTGIYRDVWLTVLDPVHVTRHGVFLTTPAVTDDIAEVNSTCEVVNQSAETAEVTVSAEVRTADGMVVSAARTTRSLAAGASWQYPLYHPVPNPRRWDVDVPYLYQVMHRVSVGDQVVDEVVTPLGIRTFRFDADKGFFLNGRPLLIKGVCNHHDAGNLGAAVPRAVLERRLRILKEMGANAIRCSHNPMEDHLYQLCDELGFLMMDEAFDEWEIGKRKWVKGRNHGHADRFGYSEDFEEWAVRDAAAMARRARKHPSVILYSIGNEIDYPTDPYVHPRSRKVEIFQDDPSQPSMTRLAAVAPALIAAVKSEDPTRPVTMALSNATAANAIGLADMLDVAGYNYQEQAYQADHAAFPGRVIYGSENGDDPRAWRAVTHNDFISAQFLWTGFDFLGEAGEWPEHGSRAGMFDTAGWPKRDALLRSALWSEKPFLRLGFQPRRGGSWRSHWNPMPGGDRPVRVVAYSNLPKVSLSLNGRDLGAVETQDGVATWEVPWEAGKLEASAADDEGKRHVDAIETTGAPVALRVTPDRSNLTADGRDAVHLTVELVDSDGRRVPDDDREVSVTCESPLHLAALESGDLRDNSRPKAPARRTRDGRLLAILQARGNVAGKGVVKAEAEGLPSVQVSLSLEP
ncbi:MAG: glycoside hydrolase family 2 protein [Akkermansiaceae bacterium]|nr:glycoside hydrolase family 2 protein [Akkermansiaceae bacterium]